MMKLHNSFHNGKPDTIALRCVGFIGLVEFCEDLFLLLGWDLAPSIADLNTKIIAFIKHFKLDRTAPRNKLYGVVDQIDPYLLEHFFVCFNHKFIKIKLKIYIFA